MLTYLYLAEPKLLLIDEPDAHLHSRLQARLGEVLRNMAIDIGAQLFISTHSVDLVDSFSTEQVMIVDCKKEQIRALGSDKEVVEHLVDADIVDVSSLSRILASKRLVVVEDKDQTVLKAIDKAIGRPLYSKSSRSYVLTSKGISNFRAVGELGKVLSQLQGNSFEIVFLQDRDGMPDFMVDKFLKSQTENGVAPKLLDLHEIESFLLEPTLLASAAERAGTELDDKMIEQAILDAARELKAEARRMSRETAKRVNRVLPKSEKWKERDLDINVDKWFDDLDISSIEVVRAVFPGKELLKDTLKLLNKSRDKSEDEITRGKVVASLEAAHVPPSFKAFLESLT